MIVAKTTMMMRGGCCGNNGVEEAAYAGVQTMQKLIDMLSMRVERDQNKEMDTECRAVADAAVTKFKQLVSLLGRTRTGHARFRRAPILLEGNKEDISRATRVEDDEDEAEVIIQDSSGSRVYCPRPLQQLPPLPPHHQIRREAATSSYSLKRGCSSDDGSAMYCEGRCHRSKRR